MKRLFWMAIAAIAMLSVHPRSASADCGTALIGTSWNCTYICNDSSSPGEECAEFGHYGLSTDFDAYVTDFDGDDGCTCESSGTEKKPKFESSPNTFLCSETIYPSTFLGKISGKSLTMQYSDAYGYNCLYACTKNSSSTCP